jgi:hypothetical protein
LAAGPNSLSLQRQANYLLAALATGLKHAFQQQANIGRPPLLGSDSRSSTSLRSAPTVKIALLSNSNPLFLQEISINVIQRSMIVELMEVVALSQF